MRSKVRTATTEDMNHDERSEYISSRNHSPVPDAQAAASHVSKSDWVTMRLLVVKSAILPKRHRIAVIDGYPEVQFGRDVAPVGSDTARIRLKEMEVSKFHATAFWDDKRREWAIVDMGSKHGTYLKSSESGSKAGDAIGPGDRLSAMKTSSVPRRIRHLDLLTIGSTTFQSHIHQDHIPCVECSPQGGDEIPLFPKATERTPQENPGLKRSLDGEDRPKDPKKALTMLRQALLTRHDNGRQSMDSKIRYADRSAARRVRQSSSHHDAPGVALHRSDSSSGSASPAPIPNASVEGTTPIPATNIGHRLLLKQGWQPGTTLGATEGIGDNSNGLLEPLDIDVYRDRAGLGSTQDGLTARTRNWKEVSRQRRWDEAQE